MGSYCKNWSLSGQALGLSTAGVPLCQGGVYSAVSRVKNSSPTNCNRVSSVIFATLCTTPSFCLKNDSILLIQKEKVLY